MTAWADLENELYLWIPTVLEGHRSGTRTPDVFSPSNLPFHRIVHLGGPRDALNDYARFDIDTFAATRGAAKTAAEQLHDLLLPRTRLTSAIIDSVRTDASPHQAPWDNTNVRRFLATYQITARRL